MASWNRKKTTPSTEPGSARTAIQNSVELITRYEDMLRAEWEWQDPPIAVDASLLPAPKEAIKNAYWIMLSVDEDPEGLAMMRKCFVTLAQFQHGVGPEPIRTPKDEKEFVRKATRLAFASPDVMTEHLKRFEHFCGLVERERAQLVEALQSAGYWSEDEP